MATETSKELATSYEIEFTSRLCVEFDPSALQKAVEEHDGNTQDAIQQLMESNLGMGFFQVKGAQVGRVTECSIEDVCSIEEN